MTCRLVRHIGAWRGGSFNMDDHNYAATKSRKRCLDTVGAECFAINCTSYCNPVTREQGLSFHSWVLFFIIDFLLIFCLCLEYTVLSLTSLGTKYAYFPPLNSKLELQGSFDRNVETRDLIGKLGSRPERGLVDLFSALFLLTHFMYYFRILCS